MNIIHFLIGIEYVRDFW